MIKRVIVIALLLFCGLHSKEVDVRLFFHLGDEIVFVSMENEFYFYKTSSDSNEEITDKVLRSALEDVMIEFKTVTTQVSNSVNNSLVRRTSHIYDEDSILTIKGIDKNSLKYADESVRDSLKHIPSEDVPKLIDGYCGIPWFDRFDSLQIIDTIKSRHQYDKTAIFLFKYKGTTLSYKSRSGVYPEDKCLSFSPNNKSMGDLMINTSYFSVDSLHGFDALSIFLYHKRGYSYSHLIQQLLRGSHDKLKMSVVMMADHQIRFSISHK